MIWSIEVLDSVVWALVICELHLIKLYTAFIDTVGQFTFYENTAYLLI